GFDAFGGPRARDWQPSGSQLHPGGDFAVATTRGFTGHEHLDETFLLHMNGRVYDYRLGRFLSGDPIISNPGSNQSINPYSYIGNNPLSGVDPTGYSPICDTEKGETPKTGTRICGVTPTERVSGTIGPTVDIAVKKGGKITPVGSVPINTPTKNLLKLLGPED